MSPFASEAQRRYLWANEPQMAHRWAAEEKRGPFPTLPAAPRPRSFPNLIGGLVGISDRVLADHLTLYARYSDELAQLEGVGERSSWNAPQNVPPAVVEQLLATRVCDLNLDIEDRLADLLTRLRGELTARGITWFPSFYLGEGDFWTADQATSINVPWFLANDALWQMVNENDVRYSDEDLMRVLRHETGHALGYAFEIWRDGYWRRTFGDFFEPYRDEYTPDPESTDFVRNLHDSVSAPSAHYAQKHPDEDWAETFAVWIDPGSRWQEDYATWPSALAKLDACEVLLGQWGRGYGAPINTRVGQRVPYTALTYTVGEYLGVSSGPDPAVAARRRIPEVLDAVILHEAYFSGLARNAGAMLSVGPRFIAEVGASWGSFDAWALDHRQAARQAADGWVLTVWDRACRRVRNVVVAGHGGGVPADSAILLALDMHEHSYVGDHGVRAADYVAAWWQNVDWVGVSSRLDLANPPPIPVPLELAPTEPAALPTEPAA